MQKVSLSPRLRNVTRLAFGSLTVSSLQGTITENRAAEITAYAFGRGINFIDTAQYYENYDIINKALTLSGKRDDIIISTKTYAYTKELAVQAVEEARKGLNRDVIDIFMLHEQESYNTLKGHAEALDYLLECREKGIIGAVGASMHHIAAVRGVSRLFGEGVCLDVIHPIFNIEGIGIADGKRDEMAYAVNEAHSLGIGVFGMKSLGGGHLCKSAEEALTYVLGCGFIDAVALGMQSEEEIDANISFFETGSFSDKDRENLKNKKRLLHIEDYCEGCGACVKRCPSGALSLVKNAASSEKDGGELVHTYTHHAEADTSKCVLCGYCSKACPVFALKVY